MALRPGLMGGRPLVSYTQLHIRAYAGVFSPLLSFDSSGWDGPLTGPEG